MDRGAVVTGQDLKERTARPLIALLERWNVTPGMIIKGLMALAAAGYATWVFIDKQKQVIDAKIALLDQTKKGLDELSPQINALRKELEAERNARSTAAEDRAALAERLDGIDQRLLAVERSEQRRTADPVTFIEYAPNKITDSAPGGIAEMTWHYIVNYDCGRPNPVIQMKDGREFEADMKLVNFSGRKTPPNIRTKIKYRVRVPVDVAAGKGAAWVFLDYMDCKDVLSPEVEFNILEAPGGNE